MRTGAAIETTSYKECLTRLRLIQDYFGERALDGTLEPAARNIYFDAETRLSRALGELDSLVNKE